MTIILKAQWRIWCPTDPDHFTIHVTNEGLKRIEEGHWPVCGKFNTVLAKEPVKGTPE